MVKNGRQTPTNRSWKYKEKACQKQVTGQHVLYMLDNQLGTSWRDEAAEEADHLELQEPITKNTVTKEAGFGGIKDSATVVVPLSEWSALALSIEKLTANYNKLKQDHERVCAKL